MIVAGIGCRKGVATKDVLAAIDRALEMHGVARADLSALATTAFKKDEQAIFAAGEALGTAGHCRETTKRHSLLPVHGENVARKAG